MTVLIPIILAYPSAIFAMDNVTKHWIAEITLSTSIHVHPDLIGSREDKERLLLILLFALQVQILRTFPFRRRKVDMCDYPTLNCTDKRLRCQIYGGFMKLYSHTSILVNGA